ncbi:MAG: MFS transporter [Bacteroidota bacterium]
MNHRISAFIKYNLSLLLFGLLMSFFSGFGQTFLLSLYVPSIEQLLDISNTEFGSIYAVATIGSALTLPYIGGYFDKINTRHYSLFVIAGLVAALFLLSFSYHVLTVILAFFGLRLFGQGLMSHTSIASMARYFDAHRGKAIGVANLGHPVGEAILPVIIAVSISYVGWRGTLQLSALTSIIILVPLVLFLLNRSAIRIRAYRMRAHSTHTYYANVKTLDVFKQKKFWIISPVVFAVGFINTALFFFQLKLGQARGWNPEWVAASIAAFAFAGAVGMLVMGSLVDRFTAKKMFPFHMIFYLIGLLALIFFEHRIVYPIALTFFGLGHGTGNTLKDAMLAEIYGTDIIGKIRSLFITVMVLSTALGPVIFGVLLDLNVSYSAIFTYVLIGTLFVTLNGFRRIE